jgi:DNA-binding response OmpR family regulator
LDPKESEPALYVCKRVAEKNGWRVVVDTHGDGESALRLLKLRNWDAAFIDNDLTKLSGTNCLLEFRDWESRVRTVKQRNIYIMSNTQSAVTGFDGVLMKPLNPLELVNVFESASFKINHVTINTGTSKRKSSLLSFI